MKARIEKKLSKKIKELLPDIYKGAWIDRSDFSELAYNQGSCVSNVWCIGGGVDYWGEGQDAYSCWEYLRYNWDWIFDFPRYPDGHELAGHPNTSGFNPTTIKIIKLAKAHTGLL